MSYRPLGDRVLIKPIVEEKESVKGGVYIVEGAREKSKFAYVNAIGSRVTMVKVGDKVMFSEYSGSEVGEEEDKQLLISELDIMAIVED